MKAKYDLTVTYTDENGAVKQDTFSKIIFDYISNGQYFFVQEEDSKQDEAKFTNKIHWYPTSRILRIDGTISRTFETKAEQKDYYAAKAGIKVKGNAVKN